MALTKVHNRLIENSNFNVKDYGAVGDGVADDRVAINAAFTDCINAGGGTVFFPNGTYYITDYIGNTTSTTDNISIHVRGDADVTINSNPSVYSNSALYLRFTNLNEALVENIKVHCNTKTAQGIIITGTNATNSVIVENCYVQDCHAVNNVGVTASAFGVYISSASGYAASVKNTQVLNVTRDKTGLASQGIVCTGFLNTFVENNNIFNVRHSGQAGDKIDADGIVIFSYNTSGSYDGTSVATATNNRIVDCEGRYFKLQTAGNANIIGNTMVLNGAIELQQNFIFVDSQVANATIENNIIRAGASWTGGSSAAFVSLQSAEPTTVRHQFESFYQKFNNNSIYSELTFPYGILPQAPATGNNATHYLEIKNNTIAAKASLTTTTQTTGNYATSNFLYISSCPTPANFDAEWVWDISGNKIFSYNFINLTFTQNDYTNQMFWYIYDNFKPSVGYSRALFVDGVNSPYTSTLMVRDNHIGTGPATFDIPLDFSKVFEGTDFAEGGSAGGVITNVPANYRNSRMYKKGGMWGVHSGTKYYISSDATTWTTVV